MLRISTIALIEIRIVQVCDANTQYVFLDTHKENRI